MNTHEQRATASPLPLADGSAPSNAAITEIASIAGNLSLFGQEEIGQKILNALEVLALRIEHLESRKKWWMDNATELGKERGELFRAGEEMQKHLEPRRVGYSTAARDARAAWDAAAQPVRDMVAALTPASLQNKADIPNFRKLG